MKNSCLGILLKALLLAVAVAAVTASIGWFLGWRTPRAFSDGLFWAAVGVLLIGLLSVLGGQGVRANIGMLYSESAGDRLSDRTRRWVAGISEEYGTMLLLLFAGGFIMLISILVDTAGG